jgi:SAM-dependent methyltransferase
MTSLNHTGFKDHFSSLAGNYANFRPSYPPPLFSWLAGLAPASLLAWDCAAGSGQATLGLVQYFERVVATDASHAQIAAAPPIGKVEYRVALAEQSGLPDACVDLIVVAQALHWFDLDLFYQEAARVLVPQGVLAAWAYGVQQVEGEEINELLHRFYAEIVGPYWPPERRLVESGYWTLPFPFQEIPAPCFSMEMHWTLPELLGYLRSWSATSRYTDDRGHDPVELLELQIKPLWGSLGKRRRVSWPLSFRVGRKP